MKHYDPIDGKWHFDLIGTLRKWGINPILTPFFILLLLFTLLVKTKRKSDRGW